MEQLPVLIASSWRMAIISATMDGSIFDGLPSVWPCALARRRPSLVLSLIFRFSSAAIATRMSKSRRWLASLESAPLQSSNVQPFVLARLAIDAASSWSRVAHQLSERRQLPSGPGRASAARSSRLTSPRFSLPGTAVNSKRPPAEGYVMFARFVREVRVVRALRAVLPHAKSGNPVRLRWIDCAVVEDELRHL